MAELTEKDLRELLKVADVDDEGKLVETFKLMRGELDEFKRNQDATTQEKEFSERYPQYWEEHNKLMARTREHEAKTFTDSISRVRKAEGNGLKETRLGLSTMAKEKIEEVHIKFAEGSANAEDFEDCVKTIMNGGLLEFGEIGTSKNGEDQIPDISTDTAAGIAGNRKVFSEVLAKIQSEKPDISFNEALAEATKKYPDLAEAYKITLPA